MMKLRLAQPEVLVDINGLAGSSPTSGWTATSCASAPWPGTRTCFDSAVAGEHFPDLR